MKACPECGKDKQVKGPFVIGRCDYCGKEGIVGEVYELESNFMDFFKEITKS